MPRGTNKRPTKYNWLMLKEEFLRGEWLTVHSFLCYKKLNPALTYNREIQGWTREKNEIMKKSVEIAKQEVFEEEVNEEKQVRRRQAQLARKLQLKGIESLEGIKPENIEVDEARKLIQTGLIQERDALGIDEELKGGVKSLTQVNVNLPKTKFDQIIDGLDAEGILKLIAEIRRQRTLRSGTSTGSESQAEVIG